MSSGSVTLSHQRNLNDSNGAQPQLRERLISGLLNGSFANQELVKQQARLVGFDLTAPQAVLLIDANDGLIAPEDKFAQRADESLRERRVATVKSSAAGFYSNSDDAALTSLPDGHVAVLIPGVPVNQATERGNGSSANSSWANLSELKRVSETLRARLARDLNSPIDIGIGRYHLGTDGIAKSYREARLALSLGRDFRGSNRVHSLDELGIAAFVALSDEQTKVDLAKYLLSPLDRESELLHTLDVFFANDCSPSPTATQLSVHRNTLRYRLEKVSALTGLNPNRFDDAVIIRLALLLRAQHP